MPAVVGHPAVPAVLDAHGMVVTPAIDAVESFPEVPAAPAIPARPARPEVLATPGIPARPESSVIHFANGTSLAIRETLKQVSELRPAR